MLPADFISRYGKAVWRTVTVRTTADGRIPPDPNRVVILFWSTTVNTTVRPGDTDTEAAPGVPWSTTDKPWGFNHHEHATVVNLGFLIAPFVAGDQFTYVTATMPSDRPSL